MKRPNKKGQISSGAWGGLVYLAIIMGLFGLILTIISDVDQDLFDDACEAKANCGRNSTGGTGGTISYEACRSCPIANESLQADLKLAEKQGTLVTAGVGIFILSLLIAGFAIYKIG